MRDHRRCVDYIYIIYTHTHTHIYIYICECMYVRIHTRARAHTHSLTHTHTRTHTHTHSERVRLLAGVRIRRHGYIDTYIPVGGAARSRRLDNHIVGQARIGLYKTFFHFCVCKNQSSLYYLRPFRITHSTAIILHDVCVIYGLPPTLSLYALHHTMLVITISCKGQARRAPPFQKRP